MVGVHSKKEPQPRASHKKKLATAKFKFKEIMLGKINLTKSTFKIFAARHKAGGTPTVPPCTPHPDLGRKPKWVKTRPLRGRYTLTGNMEIDLK
jgi:hypothetical protein